MTAGKPDLTIAHLDEEDYPASSYCEAGNHVLKEGTLFQGAPVKWYRVSGPLMPKPLVTCELCFVVANSMAQRKKRHKKILGE